ncbi:MAG: hypothetical protein O2958_06095 [Gemmatimonadetes bacterium]|nr:hypothetical protein [Gemmatimonadota bacterium]
MIRGAVQSGTGRVHRSLAFMSAKYNTFLAESGVGNAPRCFGTLRSEAFTDSTNQTIQDRVQFLLAKRLLFCCHKRGRIALETREIYAPLAHRLGMAAIRWELEDLAFKFLEPDAYERPTKRVKQRRKEREREILEMQRPLEEALEAAGIPAAVVGRPKHLWSIHRNGGTPVRGPNELWLMAAQAG